MSKFLNRKRLRRMSKTGNSYFTFCNLADKRRKWCVYQTCCERTVHSESCKQSPGCPLPNACENLWDSERHIQQARSLYWCPGNGKLGKRGNQRFRADQKKPWGWLTIFHHQSGCLCLFSINTTGLQVNEKNPTHLSGTLAFLFRKW